MDINTLIGKPYRDFDEAGNYIGCFEPLYDIYANLPKFQLPEVEASYFAYAVFHISENFKQVKTPKELDLIVFRFPGNILHVGIFLEGRKFLHVQRGSAYEIIRLAPYENKILGYFRPKYHLKRKS